MSVTHTKLMRFTKTQTRHVLLSPHIVSLSKLSELTLKVTINLCVAKCNGHFSVFLLLELSAASRFLQTVS